MTREIEIGGKPIKFTANGATPVFYKMFFRKDLLKEITSSDDGLILASDSVPELAFIMAKQADGADMYKLEHKHYIEFLTLFNPLDLPIKGAEIFGVYTADSVPTEESKKKTSGKAKE